jgi:hypothetical protein
LKRGEKDKGFELFLEAVIPPEGQERFRQIFGVIAGSITVSKRQFD